MKRGRKSYKKKTTYKKKRYFKSKIRKLNNDGKISRKVRV